MPNFCEVRCALSEEVEAAAVMTDNRHSCGANSRQRILRFGFSLLTKDSGLV